MSDFYREFRDGLPANVAKWAQQPRVENEIRNIFRAAVEAIPPTNGAMYEAMLHAAQDTPGAWRPFWLDTIKAVRAIFVRRKGGYPDSEQLGSIEDEPEERGDLGETGWFDFLTRLSPDVEAWAYSNGFLMTIHNRLGREVRRRERVGWPTKFFYTAAPPHFDHEYVETVDTFTIPSGPYGGTYRKIKMSAPDDRTLAVQIHYQKGRYNSGLYQLDEVDPRQHRADWEDMNPTMAAGLRTGASWAAKAYGKEKMTDPLSGAVGAASVISIYALSRLANSYRINLNEMLARLAIRAFGDEVSRAAVTALVKNYRAPAPVGPLTWAERRYINLYLDPADFDDIPTVRAILSAALHELREQGAIRPAVLRFVADCTIRSSDGAPAARAGEP